MLKLIYVAGPYRSKTLWGVEQNIRAAEDVGARVLMLGAYPVIPHANTRGYFDIQSDDFMLEATLELMRRCDAALFIPRWMESSGARGERREAHRIELPCFESLDDLEQALIATRAGERLRWGRLAGQPHPPLTNIETKLGFSR